ncbi:unnamed protein product [Lota lota]
MLFPLQAAQRFLYTPGLSLLEPARLLLSRAGPVGGQSYTRNITFLFSAASMGSSLQKVEVVKLGHLLRTPTVSQARRDHRFGVLEKLLEEGLMVIQNLSED